METIIKKNFPNNLNDILYGYDKINKKYVKIYDFNSFSHIVQNTITNNIEEQSNKNFINGLDDLLIYYSIIGFLIIWPIIIIFHNFIFKRFFSMSLLCKFFNKDSTTKENIININKINNELNNNFLKKELN